MSPTGARVERIDKVAAATQSALHAESETAGFLIYDPAFADLIGPSPTLDVIRESKYARYHEAGVFLEDQRALVVTSNQLPQGEDGGKRIEVTKVALDTHDGSRDEELHGVTMANGGVNYHQAGILICAQGYMHEPSGLVYMSAYPPHGTKVLLNNFYGRQFSSVNDVVISNRDGSIWFTDPCYGANQGFRPAQPDLPNQVYRFDSDTGDVRVVADGFDRPNGIAFSPDETVVYITDTGIMHNSVDRTRPATIYAFELHTTPAPFLANRRVFAYTDAGWPDGIKCDVHGNVYSGCCDGVHVWNPQGSLLGKIAVPGGIANFCFGKQGEMFLMNETKLWRAQLSNTTLGALLRI